MSTNQEEDGMPKGVLAVFIRNLSDEQRARWDTMWPVFRGWRTSHRKLAASGVPVKGKMPTVDTVEAISLVEIEPDGQQQLRTALQDAFAGLKSTVTAEKLAGLVNKAVDKGDAQALRVLANMAGIDLTGSPANAGQAGIKVVVLEPFDSEYQQARATIEQAGRMLAQ